MRFADLFSSDLGHEKGFHLSEAFGVATGAVIGASLGNTYVAAGSAVAGKYIGRAGYNLYDRFTSMFDLG